MRLAMAIGTLRYITVLVLVAVDTCQLAVLAGGIRQFGEYLGMAGAASVRGDVLAEADLQRLMNRMALETG